MVVATMVATWLTHHGPLNLETVLLSFPQGTWIEEESEGYGAGAASWECVAAQTFCVCDK